MMQAWRGVTLAAALLGASGVALAAVGAHVTGESGAAAWQAANLMHLVHALALLGIAAFLHRGANRGWVLAGAMMVLGVFLFSGSIYRAGLLGLDGAGPLAPLGGSLLILSWLVLGVAAWRERS